MEHNFFEGVIGENQKPKTNVFRLIMILIIVGALGYLSVGAGFNLFQLFDLRSEIDRLQLANQNALHAELLSDTQEDIRYLELKFDYMYRVDFLSRHSHSITLRLLNALPDLTPADVVVDSIIISGRRMTMHGHAADLVVLAQFEHILRNSPLLHNTEIRRATFVVVTSETLEEDLADYFEYYFEYYFRDYFGDYFGDYLEYYLEYYLENLEYYLEYFLEYFNFVLGAYRFEVNVYILSPFTALDRLFHQFERLDVDDEVILKANDDSEIWDDVFRILNIHN